VHFKTDGDDIFHLLSDSSHHRRKGHNEQKMTKHE
jgi:hypothetical protein